MSHVQPETKGDDILPEEVFDRKVMKLIETRDRSTLPYEHRNLTSIASFALLDHKLDGLAALVDPAQQAQNAAEAAARIAELEVKSVARIAALELKVASAAEIGAAAQPVLAALERQNTALERLEAGQAAQNTRLAALEARPVCCIIS